MAAYLIVGGILSLHYVSQGPAWYGEVRCILLAVEVAPYVALAAILGGLVIIGRLHRLEVVPEGGSGWILAAALIVFFSAPFITLIIPTLACPRGSKLLEGFPTCWEPTGHRFPATSYRWLQLLIIVGGTALLAGALVAVEGLLVMLPGLVRCR